MEIVRQNKKFYSRVFKSEHRTYRYSTGARYQGEFRGNLRHGLGKMEWPDGTTYEGLFDYNLANGQGKMIFSTGDVYDGSFRSNKFYGKGVYKQKKKDSEKEYSGYWVNGMKQG